VAKIDIDYAKTAKKLDVKRLKSSMWNLMKAAPKDPEQVRQTHFYVPVTVLLLLSHSYFQCLSSSGQVVFGFKFIYLSAKISYLNLFI
jgi:hypothetical protein